MTYTPEDKALIEQTEEDMKYSTLGCTACFGRGTRVGVVPDMGLKCPVCNGTGKIKFRKKNLKLEELGPILEENSLKDYSMGVKEKR